MDKPMTTAQMQRQNTRDGGGRYAAMHRTEADVDLNTPAGRPEVVEKMVDDDGSHIYVYEDGVVLRDNGISFASFDADGTYRPHETDPTTAYYAMTRLGVLPGERRHGRTARHVEMIEDPAFQEYAEQMYRRHADVYDADAAAAGGRDPWSEQTLESSLMDEAFARRAGRPVVDDARHAHSAAWARDVMELYRLPAVAKAHPEGIPRSKGGRRLSSDPGIVVFTADVAGRHRSYVMADDSDWPTVGKEVPVDEAVDVTDLVQGVVADNHAHPDTMIGRQSRPRDEFERLDETQLAAFRRAVSPVERTYAGRNAHQAVADCGVDGWSLVVGRQGRPDNAVLVLDSPDGTVDSIQMSVDDARSLGVRDITPDWVRTASIREHLGKDGSSAQIEGLDRRMNQAYMDHAEAIEENERRAVGLIQDRCRAARQS